MILPIPLSYWVLMIFMVPIAILATLSHKEHKMLLGGMANRYRIVALVSLLLYGETRYAIAPSVAWQPAAVVPSHVSIAILWGLSFTLAFLYVRSMILWSYIKE